MGGRSDLTCFYLLSGGGKGRRGEGRGSLSDWFQGVEEVPRRWGGGGGEFLRKGEGVFRRPNFPPRRGLLSCHVTFWSVHARRVGSC